MTAEFLKTHAKTLNKFAQETAAASAENPEDFWLKLAAKNQLDAAKSIEHEYALLTSQNAGELVDLRFIGPQANGSISLESFLKIIAPLSNSWKLAAHRLKYGKDEGRADQDLSDDLSLKLAGISYGSTRIFITGATNPDLAGESLLHATLVQTFGLLNAKNDNFYDAVYAIGSRAAIQIRDSMRAIHKAGLAAEYTWQSPSGRFFWQGTPAEILRIKALLDGIEEPEEYPEIISGIVSRIADTGLIELRTDEGKISIRFPLALTHIAKQLHIAMPAKIQVSTSKYHNVALDKDIYKRQMIAVLD